VSSARNSWVAFSVRARGAVGFLVEAAVRRASEVVSVLGMANGAGTGPDEDGTVTVSFAKEPQ
jgi:hypothetical protein